MKLITLACVIFAMSCKKEVKNDSIKQQIQEVLTTPKKKEFTCEEYLLKFIQNSNLQNYFKPKLKAKVEEISDNNLKINLFVCEENKENTVGWLIMDLQKRELLDITNDIESPEKLKYSNELWDKVVNCYYPKDTNEKISSKNVLHLKCSDLGGDFENGFVTECISNENKDLTYVNFRNNYFEEGNKLLKVLPKNDTIYNYENVQISYKLKKSSIDINLDYSGGNTEISILEENKNTKIIQKKYPD